MYKLYKNKEKRKAYLTEWRKKNRERLNKYLKNYLKKRGNIYYTRDRKGFIKKVLIHKIIEKVLGRPMKCDICGSVKEQKYEWSNKDHKYGLRKKDWQRLCSYCHAKYDREFNGKKTYLEEAL